MTDKKLAARIEDLELSLGTIEANCERRLVEMQTSLRARIDELLGRLTGDPNERMRLAVSTASDDLRSSLAQALDQVRRADALAQASEARARGEGEHQPRLWMKVGQIYRAPYTGYVALYTTRGPTSAELRVGPSDPPREVVGVFDGGSPASDAYVGCIVRRGEYWQVHAGEYSNPDLKCVYTPFL